MSKKNAVMLILLGGTFMSFVGLYMRLVTDANGFQILFYRSLSLCAIVGFVSCLRRRIGPVQFLRRLDQADFKMGSALALAFTCYVFAMLYTSIASTLFILSATPFIAAIIGWVWINEKPQNVTWIAMIFASCGVYLMVREGAQLGQSFGNVMALISAACFALMLVLARKSGKQDVLGGTFTGGAICALIGAGATLFSGASFAVFPQDLVIILIMGAFGIGIGIAFVTWGASYVPAAEVSLLVLIESVLGPIWPWIFLGEAMSPTELAGGLTILASVALFARVSAKPETKRNAQNSAL